MKKLLILFFAIATVATTSCKKEAALTPSKMTVKSSDKTDVGSWD